MRPALSRVVGSVLWDKLGAFAASGEAAISMANDEKTTAARRHPLAAYLLAAVPLIGVVELALHVKQTTVDVVPDSDWAAARDAIKGDVKADDLVIFAPFWADPIGREHFGDAYAGIDREARPDESRFARAFEVGIHGMHRPELAGWKKTSEKQVGKITIGVYENPAPAKVITDLVKLLDPSQVTVARVENGNESPCTYQRGVGQPGGLGVPQGIAVPGDKFVCSGGGYAGVAVLHALDHHPHLCIWATPQGAASAMRVKFSKVTFGSSLHGHTGIQWVSERTPAPQDRMFVSFTSGGRPIGTSVHRVGIGWNAFEHPTAELAGKTADLVAEISASGPARPFCFEADTR